MSDEWQNALSKEQVIVPDAIEPIVGYRTWRLVFKHGNWFLTSLRDRSEVWEPKFKHTSKCPIERCTSNRDPQIKVAEGCSFCGMHVFENAQDAKEYDGDVWGECQIDGQVVLHDNGYRAEKARITAIYLPDDIAHPAIIDSLMERYSLQAICTPNKELDLTALEDRFSVIKINRKKREHAIAYYQKYSHNAVPWHENWGTSADRDEFFLIINYKKKDNLTSTWKTTAGGADLYQALDAADEVIGNPEHINVFRLPVVCLNTGTLFDPATQQPIGNIFSKNGLPKPNQETNDDYKNSRDMPPELFLPFVLVASFAMVALIWIFSQIVINPIISPNDSKTKPPVTVRKTTATLAVKDPFTPSFLQQPNNQPNNQHNSPFMAK